MKTDGTTEVRSPFFPPEHSGDKVDYKATVARGEWAHVFFTYDGSGKAAGVKIYVNGVLQKVKVEHDKLTGTIRTEAPTLLGRRHEGEPMQATAYQDVRIYGRALSAEEVARLPREDVAAEIIARKKPADWTDDERKVVEDFYFAQVDGPTKRLKAKIPALDAELVKLAAGGDVTLICREKPGLPYADVLTRGGYSSRTGRTRRMFRISCLRCRPARRGIVSAWPSGPSRGRIRSPPASP